MAWPATDIPTARVDNLPFSDKLEIIPSRAVPAGARMVDQVGCSVPLRSFGPWQGPLRRARTECLLVRHGTSTTLIGVAQGIASCGLRALGFGSPG